MPGLEDIDKEIADVLDDVSREMENMREGLRNGSRPSSGAVLRHVDSDTVPSAVSSLEFVSSKEKSDGQHSAPTSLADQINKDTDEVELELKAMEEELQQQLMQYKATCEGTPKAKAPTTETPSVLEASTTARRTSSPSRPSSKPTGTSKEQPHVCPSDPEEPLGEIITPELLDLRAEAAKMDEAFPEVEGNTEESEIPGRRQRIRRTRDNSRAEIPEDPETVELTHLLGSLDARLGAIQQKHGTCDVLERESGYASSTAGKVIKDLQAQNAHLREKFQTSNKRGVLGLDASVFGASDFQPKAQ